MQVTLLTGYVNFGTVCPLEILQINIVECEALNITGEIQGSMQGKLMTFPIFNLRPISKFVTGWTARGSDSGWGEIFRNRPDRPCGLPYDGYLGFAGDKVTGMWC